jgi:Ni2+-binding GTPase involved in maturation of urease and hydrogenase
MKTRLIFVGGFLGAGKTSLLLQSLDILKQQGYRVAVITNDQGSDLVDTMLARSCGADVAEVVGGCFCCRFHDLLKTIQDVSDTLHPDVILAEPVGSCTDVVATVLKPLERDFSDVYEVAPFTVLVDPERSLAGFPASLDDLFHWQLGEADLIAVSKSDLLTDAQIQAQQQRLRGLYPGKPILSLSARTEAGIAEWLAQVLHPPVYRRNIVPVDYIVYAEAEACLGWLNASLSLQGESPFSPQQWITNLLMGLREDLYALDAEIAHLKVHIYGVVHQFKASLTGLDRSIDWDLQDRGLVTSAAAVVNARVHCNPDVLQWTVEQAVQRASTAMYLSAQIAHLECFSPSPPQPIFRLT